MYYTKGPNEELFVGALENNYFNKVMKSLLRGVKKGDYIPEDAKDRLCSVENGRSRLLHDMKMNNGAKILKK